MTSPQKSTVILSNPSDWDEWLEIIKTKAVGGEVWKFIDPAIAKDELPSLTEPTIPTPQDVNPDKTSLAQLNDDEKEELRFQRLSYKRKIATFDRQKAAMATLRSFIQETVTRTYLTYTFGCDTPHDMLVALKQRVAPTDQARKIELITQYQKLKKAPRGQNLDTWLQQWEKTYKECKQLKLPDVEDDRPLYDFLNAISGIAPEFANVWTINIQMKLDNGDALPNLYKIVELFRNNRRLSNAQKGLATHGAFPATFQGQLIKNDSEKKPPCLCGGHHWYKECPYLIESIRIKDWKPNPSIEKKIDEKLQKNLRLKETIDRIRKEQEEKSTSTQTDQSTPSAFTVSAASAVTTDYHLRDSFILDSGATLHICNDRTRFQDIRPTSDEELLYAGNAVIPIDGFGSVTITIQAPGGPRPITLREVAYVPSFHTNVASLNRFIAKDVHWDTKDQRLIHNDHTFCSIQRQHGQWVLEYNEPKESAFVVRSAQPRKDEEVSAEIWHRRLGHIQPAAIAKLPTAVLGVTPPTSNGPSTIQCETCSVSKAKEVISRRPSPRATKPFERVHFDLIQMVEGYDGSKWVTHFLDDYTKMNFVYIQKGKGQTTRTVQDFVALVRRQYKRDIQILHTDDESSLGNIFDSWTAGEGFTIETSAAYTPAQNGSAERSGAMLIRRARAIRIDARLPENLWPEAFMAAGYLINRSPTKRLDWETPIGMLEQALNPDAPKRPNIAHLRVYGCRAYPLRYNIARTRKLEPRAHIGYLVGYDSTNIFRVWIPSEERVVATRDVTFQETVFYDPKEPDLASQLRLRADQILDVIEVTHPSSSSHTDDIDTDSDDEEEIGDTIIVRPRTNEPREESGQQIEETQQAKPPTLPTPEDTPEPVHHTPREIIGNVDSANVVQGSRTRRPTEKARRQAYFTALDQPEELPGYHAAFAAGFQYGRDRLHRDQMPPPPRSWKDLQTHPYREGFQTAATKEYQDLERRNTFKPVPKTSKITTLPLIWVFTYKFDTDGYLIKFKARLCVRGDLQPLTHQDNYAATLAARTFRALMAITAAFDLETWQADAVNAFTNSDLDETVYCDCPEGFKLPGFCLQLFRALYGLRRSPLLWLKEFSGTLTKLGLIQVGEDVCLFANDWLIVFFYVDDIVSLCRTMDLPKLDRFK